MRAPSDPREPSADGLVSIGMPVFNDRQFLVPALDSLLAQSFSHFELIISDDGSTDGSEEICREYAGRDPRIRYIRQPRNLGISLNMMFLLSAAHGEYMLWAANDDLWHPEFLMTLVTALNTNREAISAFTPNYFINESGARLALPAARATDYSGRTPYRRLTKLIRAFDDGFGYGLFRRASITEVEFPTWRWINRRRAGNNIYPTLCYYLAKGNFVLAGDEPMWFNRLKLEENVHHKVPYNDTYFRGYFAYVLWKFNLVAVSLRQISRARNVGTATLVAPSMVAHWIVGASARELIVRTSRVARRKIRIF